MATQSSETHHKAQLALAALIASLVRQIFIAFFDPRRPKESQPKLTAALEAVAVQYGNAAAAAALTYYRLEHAKAGGSGAPKLKMPPAISHAEVAALVEDFINEVQASVNVPSLAPSAPGSTVTVPQSKAVIDAEDALTKEMEQLVYDHGQQALGDAVAVNKSAKGWARIPEPDCCSFCALLAIRGPVFRDDSFEDSNAKFIGPGSAKVHNNCRCGIEPIFGIYEPSAQIRAWTKQYEDSTKKAYGGPAKQKAFRREIENRANGAEYKPKKSGKATFDPTKDVDAGKSKAELQSTLDALETSAKKFDSKAAKARRDELRRKIAARG